MKTVKTQTPQTGSFLDRFEEAPAKTGSFLDQFEEAQAQKGSFLDKFEEGNEGYGFMRETGLPFLASLPGASPGALGGAALGALTGPAAPVMIPLLSGMGAGLTGGMTFRATQEALTDQEWGKVADPSSVGWDTALGGGLGVLSKGTSAAWNAFWGAGKAAGNAAVTAAGDLPKMGEVLQHDEALDIVKRAVDAQDLMRGDTLISDTAKLRNTMKDWYDAGFLDENTYTKWASAQKHTLDEARAGLNLDELYPNGMPAGVGFLQRFRSPAKRMQSLGDEMLEMEFANGPPDPKRLGAAQYVRAQGDAMSLAGEWSRRARTLYDLQTKAIRGMVPNPKDPGFLEHVEGFVGPRRPGGPGMVERWLDLQDDLAEEAKAVGLLTEQEGNWLPFRPVEKNYVPHFFERASEPTILSRGIKGLGGKSRQGADPAQLVTSFDEIVKRQRLRDPERLANAVLFGGLEPSGYTAKVGGYSPMEGLAQEGLALLRSRGLSEPADIIAHFMKATHEVTKLPEQNLIRRLRDAGASMVLAQNWTIQSTEMSKSAAYSGGVSTGLGDVIRGAKLSSLFPRSSKTIGSTTPYLRDALGEGSIVDPKTASMAVDWGTRKLATWGAGGMVERVSAQAAKAVAKGKKFRGSLLKEAGEIAGRRFGGNEEEAVRYLARRWATNGDRLAEDVWRDGVDSLTGRWMYNFDPGTAPLMMQSPLGQLGFSYRFYGLRAWEQFRDDALKPLLRGRDASERLLGFSRIAKMTGYTIPPAVMHRAIRVMLAGNWDKMNYEDWTRMTTQDVLGTAMGLGADLGMAVITEAARQGDMAGFWDADWAKRGGLSGLKRTAEPFPIYDITTRAAEDVLSGKPKRIAKGALSAAQGLGGAFSDDPKFAWMKALAWTPRRWLESDE